MHDDACMHLALPCVWDTQLLLFSYLFPEFFLPRMEAGPPGGALNNLLSIYLDPFIFFEPPI